jgi:hypothetical protein
MGVGDGGEVGVDGGTVVAVGTTGVDSSGLGEGVPAGVSVGTQLASAGAVAVAPAGVRLSSATVPDSRPLVRAEKPTPAPIHITSKTTMNATAELLLCMEISGPFRQGWVRQLQPCRSGQVAQSYTAALTKARTLPICGHPH